MRKLVYIFALALLPFINEGQNFSSLSEIIKHEAIFFNRANKRDVEVKSRLAKLVNSDKVDTIIILLNRYMNAVKDSTRVPRDDREYLIYRTKGKVYVDYYFYPDATQSTYNQSIKNPFDSAQALFDYFIKHKIDTIKGKYKFDSLFKPAELAEFKGYINIADDFYNLRYLPKTELNVVEADERAMFYKRILQALRKAGY